MASASTPTVWTKNDLATQVEAAIGEFVSRRLSEPSDRYPAHAESSRKNLSQVLQHLLKMDLDNPDPAQVQYLLAQKDFFDSLRYLAGPPVSSDDLGVLVTRRTEKITTTAIKTDPELAVAVMKRILQLVDRGRFPWIASGRKPRGHEVKSAIEATVALHASQKMQTERRAYGKAVEQRLVDELINLGYTKGTPNGKGITLPSEFPSPMTFFGECSLHGRRADVIIGLHDRRIVAVESKDSSSVVNSVKRVLNDTAAKARGWSAKMGEIVVPVALLSGVFGLENLMEAQKQGLFLVWSHDLADFTNWLKAMHPNPMPPKLPPRRRRKKP